MEAWMSLAACGSVASEWSHPANGKLTHSGPISLGTYFYSCAFWKTKRKEKCNKKREKDDCVLHHSAYWCVSSVVLKSSEFLTQSERGLEFGDLLQCMLHGLALLLDMLSEYFAIRINRRVLRTILNTAATNPLAQIDSTFPSSSNMYQCLIREDRRKLGLMFLPHGSQWAVLLSHFT